MATRAGTRHVRPGNSLEIMIGVHLTSTPTTQSVFTYTTTICMQLHRTTVCRQGFTAVVRAADSESRGVSNSAWPIPHYPLPPPPTIQYIFPSIYMYSDHWMTLHRTKSADRRTAVRTEAERCSRRRWLRSIFKTRDMRRLPPSGCTRLLLLSTGRRRDNRSLGNSHRFCHTRARPCTGHPQCQRRRPVHIGGC